MDCDIWGVIKNGLLAHSHQDNAITVEKAINIWRKVDKEKVKYNMKSKLPSLLL